MPTTAIHNPRKRRGDSQPHFIQRVVTDVIVFRATDGEVMLGGQAKINGEIVTVYTHGIGPYSVLGQGQDIRVREIITQRGEVGHSE
jgi:hypothetical protein